MKFSAVSVIAAAAVVAPSALVAPASALAARADTSPARVSTPPVMGAPIPTAGVAQTSGQAVVPRPRDLASDKTALTAYATYLTALVRTASLGQLSDSDYVTTIAGQCKGALEPLTQPNEQVNATVQATLTALGEEMADDLSIGFDQVALSPFLRLSTSLSRLRWTRSSGGAAVIRRFVTTENTVLGLPQSALCENALLAASPPHTIPVATKSFIREYARTSTAANAALTNLLKLMQAYETSAERAVITRIANLAAQLSRVTKSGLQSNGSSLASTLET